MRKEIYECEVKLKGEWTSRPVGEVRLLGDVPRRCKECHGPIVLMKAGPNGVPRAHAEHRPRNVGCSLGHYFDGNRRPSPYPVE